MTGGTGVVTQRRSLSPVAYSLQFHPAGIAVAVGAVIVFPKSAMKAELLEVDVQRGAKTRCTCKGQSTHKKCFKE